MKRSLVESSCAALFFLAATAVMTWPQVLHLSDGMTDIWDAKLVAWILHWDWYQFFRHPLELFQATFFHPAKYVLAFSENLFGAAVFGFPLLAAGASPLLNYNALLLLGMFLSALSAWALARHVTGDPVASSAAGIIYAFLPWRFSQIPHLQHQWGAFLCLLLLFLLRYLDSGRRPDAVLFAVCFAWNALANVHYAIFSSVIVGVVLLLFALRQEPERGRRIRGALLAAAVGGLAFLPFAIGYRRAAELYGMKRYLGEMMTYSGRWSDFLSAGEKNKLYGAVTGRWWRAEGDFFPGLAAVALAGIAVSKLRGGTVIPAAASTASRGKIRIARVLDGMIAVAGAVWIAAIVQPGLRIGALRIGDPGRVQVLVTLLVLARLSAAFPKRSSYASLGDFLRRSGLDPRLVLLLAIAAAGIVVALGANTPYYLFLFQSFGAVFRAIRAPSRGIVIFDLALAVLAAWGLSLLIRDRSRFTRVACTAAAIAVLGFEYRAFPLGIHPVDAQAPPVYQWLKTLELPGAVIEWPLGPNDTEYMFRQTAHAKPLINGYSGFFPRTYLDLQAILGERPIPPRIWGAMAAADASLLVFHAHNLDPLEKLRYARPIRLGVPAGRLQPLAAFPHGDGRDFAFRLTSAPVFEARVPASAGAQADQLLRSTEAELALPFGAIDFPDEVRSGDWRWGYAIDDSGIARVEIATEAGPAGSAQIGLRRPDLPAVFPDYPNTATGGFGFLVPSLSPGRHTLFITLVGVDGGRTVLRRPIVVRR